MHALVAELIGTFLLILLGNGVVANVVLTDTKGHNSGWVVITLAWGLAVFVGVAVAGPISGAHINPAVTIGLAASGLFPWREVLPYILAQMLGAFLGTSIVWLMYRDHFRRTEDQAAKLAVFSTAPAIRRVASNFFSELVGTFVLVLVVLFFSARTHTAEVGLGAVGALPVALLVTVIGMALGGTTGYAINPARDLAPRIAHAILPISQKGPSDWSYSWIPVLGPIAGALLAALAFWLVIPSMPV